MAKRRKKPKFIFIHHSASNWGTAEAIDKWHKDKGWKGIGYHFVIQNGYPTLDHLRREDFNSDLVGKIEKGRPLNSDEWLDANEVGAHVYGYNADSIGVCLIHKNGPYEEDMMVSLQTLVGTLVKHFGIDIENVKGHYEVEPEKPYCPSIDMDDFRISLATTVEMYDDDEEMYEQLKTAFLGGKK